MTTHQGIPRTPDYDPRLNSSILNFLLSGIDGGYQKGSLTCSDAGGSLYSKTITLGQFPLYTEPCRIGFGVASVLLGLLGIGAIVAAVSKKLQHRYILVELECKKCNGGHTVLYDAITRMKRRRFGYYTKLTCMTLEVSPAKRTYEFIDVAFEEMPKRLGPPVPGAYDCQDWADELYAKIS